MPIDRIDFDSVTQRDLEELIVAQVPEGLLIDYKQEIYGNSDSDKKELLKDVSAFANVRGGHIVIGINEQDAVPTTLDGIKCESSDSEILRLEQIIRNGIEPKITGIHIRAINLNNSNTALVIRIPKSWNPPHRISFQGNNTFWIRNSRGKHPASIEELRKLFIFSMEAQEKAQRFRNERLSFLKSNKGSRPLVGNGRFILHIIPLTAFESSQQINLDLVKQNYKFFAPLGARGFNNRYNYEGFIFETGGERNHGYTQIFRNGILEATDANIIDSRDGGLHIGGKGLEENIFHSLPQFLDGMKAVGISAPLILLFTLEGVAGARYHVMSRNYYSPPFDRSEFFLPECVLENFGTELEYHRTVKPAFDALWNAIGQPRNLFFSSEGEWTGNTE